MSETQDIQTIDLAEVSKELRQVIEFDEVPEQMYQMVVSIHETAEEEVRKAWDELPASAQNVVDSFEQFHALTSVSQAFAGVGLLEEFPNLDLPADMSEEDTNAYKAQLLDKVLFNCIKDMVKQVKKARRDPILKRDFNSVFER
ncbi:hypothetical protein JCM19231_1647 [Vibrio ishigakensis]|uniref:DUF3069 domain-containing protein n=1 Tax=Vibrio ishigakensis TaxID=1481914 RepID=A0A0B8QBN5_9VIBR|nr:DUF3069 domain-containing protein [Vibrio ishigakensis]GAM57206.1 hypothetical protein JCM19231_1647 [Vibrio ishigakensis]GAM66332.1 hypothetical protein JCM19236_3784 [Vibrio sp. JCM 19236]GAM74332.1 hypothetical protein JCM19241_5528 [Vibrio ishigakensis]